MRHTHILAALVILLPGAALAQDSGSSGPVHVTFRYAELPIPKTVDSADFLQSLRGDIDFSAASFEVVNMTRLPADGGDFTKEFVSPREHVSQQGNLLGTVNFDLRAELDRSEVAWKLEVNLSVTEEIPFLVPQKVSPEVASRAHKDIVVQRYRQVGFTVETETTLEPEKETVIQADVERVGEESICRVFTVAVHP
jgi:hypothetical protein